MIPNTLTGCSRTIVIFPAVLVPPLEDARHFLMLNADLFISISSDSFTVLKDRRAYSKHNYSSPLSELPAFILQFRRDYNDLPTSVVTGWNEEASPTDVEG